ncbi:MAG: VanW family protein [Candidatus Melainabacteria bacterium]|nr:VanW family protein [Candidatus Melainabacteria bacterium]
MKFDKSYLILILPVALASGYWLERPFQARLGEAHSKITHLNRQSKTNIDLACKKINGHVIRPGESFSFNRTVGPRDNEHGFVSAPTYMGNETTNTEGGGVCLVSSLLYKAGLESGLAVLEREPHSRTISTVLPGFDATVWWGRHDMKLKNVSSEPIKIHCNADFYNVGIEFFGQKNAPIHQIVRREKPASPTQVAVTVSLQTGDKLQQISNDLYDKSVHR